MSGTLVEPAEIATGSKRSLLLSVVATFSVAIAPTFVVFAVLVFSQPDPNLALAVAASIALTIGAIAIGSALWARQPESAGFTFGDLMLWSWVRQYQAERTLLEQTRTLGFDRNGEFLGYSTVSADEQVRAMRAIAAALDAKSSYTLGHSKRVAKHARRVGKEIGLSGEKLDSLVLAARLHDVGNVALSDEVLRKVGRLTVFERSEIEASVLVGAQMVEKAGSEEVVEGIRHHHERWDGAGYPDQLGGHRIPGYARIIAIAEAYDAMTSTRPYRQSYTGRVAIEVLRAESGSQFDGELVEAFVDSLRRPFAFFERVPFLAAIQRQVRELWLVLRRMGAVAFSATASTLAIALILGSTVLSPGTPVEAPELAQEQRSAQPIDRVLGERLASTDGAVDSLAGLVAEDLVLGERIVNSGDGRVASVGGDVVLGDGVIGGGGTDPGTDPGTTPGTNPPGNGGTDGPTGGNTDPNTNPPGGGNGGGPSPAGPNPTPPSSGNTGGGTDKNPNSPGNGNAHGKDPAGPGNSENAPGHSEGEPGNSENAPGQNKDQNAGNGNSENAPGHSESGEPGNSENAPGQNKDDSSSSSASSSDESHGNSENAPGQQKQDD